MQVSKIVILSLVILVSSCAPSSRRRNSSSTSQKPTSTTSSRSSSSSSSSSQTSIGPDVDITDIPVNFTAINDFHGQLDESTGEYRVGIAKMASYLKDRKAKGDVLISSGDNYQGSYLCHLDKGKFVSEVFKDIGFDAYTIGNHEFDWGVSYILQNEAYLGEPFLGANIYNYPKDSEWTKASLGKEYKIVKLYENTPYEVKIGIIGVIGRNQITSITSTYTTDYIFLNPTQIVKDIATTLKEDEGCDVVVASYHEDEADESIASYVDAVFEAHTHTFQEDIVDGVPFLQAGAYSRGVSSVSFSFNKEDGTLTLKDYGNSYLAQMDLEPDPEVQDALNELKAAHASEFVDVIGTNATGTSISSYNMSKFYAKISYERAKIEQPTYDIKGCIYNVSRRDLKSGDFTYSDLFETHPFLNGIYILSASDKDISNQISLSYGYMDPSFVSTGSASTYHDVLAFDYNGFHIGVNSSYEKYYNNFPSAFSSGAVHPPVKLSFNCVEEAIDWLEIHHNITNSDISGSGFFPNY